MMEEGLVIDKYLVKKFVVEQRVAIPVIAKNFIAVKLE
jgi:hypothetical protein